MIIKLLTKENAQNFRELRLECLLNYPEAFGSSYEEEKLLPIENTIDRLSNEFAFSFGAFDKNKLVGIVTFMTESRNKVKHSGTIYSMYVHTKYQKNGVGRALMKEAINKAKELKHIEQIYLAVTSNNNPAIKLYNSLGFKTYGVEKKVIKINDLYYDRELMVLFL